MSVKSYITLILNEAASRGAAGKMATSRDLVARLMFDRNYSAVVAAESAAKLPVPKLDNARTQNLRAEHGPRVDVLADILSEALDMFWMYVVEAPMMTAKQACLNGVIQPPPELDRATIDRFQAEAERKGGELEWITFNPGNVFSGAHLHFVRTGGVWYALRDEFFKDGEAYLTAQMNGSVFRYRDAHGEDYTHEFLTWVFEANEWSLQLLEHLMTDPDERDLSYVELHEA